MNGTGSPAPPATPDWAEQVRQACLQAALQAYEDAGIQGLCAEGRWEAAIGAIERLDLRGLAEGPPPDHSGS